MTTDTTLADSKAERAVLGSMLIDPDAVWNVITVLQASDFNDDQHRYLYEAMYALATRGSTVDFITIVDELTRRETLAKVGGGAYISGLYNAVPSALQAMSYAGIVSDKATRRNMERTAIEWQRRIYNPTEDTDETITWAVAQLQAHGRGGELVAAKDVVEELHDEFTRYVDAPLEPGQVRGVDTGWRDLNGYLGGWKPGLYIVLGEPHVGKSWFVLQAAMNVAMQGKRALLFSLEMKAIQLVRRLCLAHAKLSQRNYDLGRVSPEQAERFAEMEGIVSEWNLDIADDMCKASSILSTIHREMRGDNPPSFIAIDYLGLIETSYNRESVNWEMMALTRTLKNTGRQLQVPIVTPHQISDKAVMMRSDKRPRLSDGYGSGGMSQDADVVIGLFVESMHNDDPSIKHRMEVAVLKDRTGGAANPRKPIMLVFAETGGLVSLAKGEDYGR